MIRNNISDFEAFENTLESTGVDFNTYYQNQKNNLYVQQLLSTLVRVQEPTSTDIKEYYENTKKITLSKRTSLSIESI